MMPIVAECDVCGKKYRVGDDLAGESIDCKDCGAQIDVPGGRARQSGSTNRSGSQPRSGTAKRTGKKSAAKEGGNAAVFIGIGVLGFLLLAGGGIWVISKVLIPRPAAAPGGMVAANPLGGSSTPPAGLPGFPGGAGGVNGGNAPSRFDLPIQPATNNLNGNAGGAAAPPVSQGPKNTMAGIGFGTVVGSTASFRNAQQGGGNDADTEFAALSEEPDSLPPDFWTLDADPPAEALAEYAPAKKPVRVKVPTTRRAEEGDVAFPVVPSPFVMVGQGGQPKDVREIWNLCTGVKVTKIEDLKVATSRTALSPDGKYLAGITGQGSNKTIGVWDVEGNKPLVDIPETELWGGQEILAIPRPDTLVAAAVRTRGQLKIWSLPGGELMREVPFEWTSGDSRPAFSPGGRYFAYGASKDWKEVISLIDLTTGDPVGDLHLPTYQGVHRFTVDGLAFSPDGTELAAIVNAWHCSKILIWNLADGAISGHMTFKKKLVDLALGGGNSRGKYNGLTFFPGGKRLLAYEHGVVDREIGSLVWVLPKSPVEFGDKRHPFGQSYVSVIDVAGNTGSVLVYELPEDKIAASAERVTQGAKVKLAYEVKLIEGGLPDPADLAGLKYIGATDTTPWGVQPDPAAAVGNVRTFPLTKGNGTVRQIAVSGGSSPKVVATRSTGRDPFGRAPFGNRTPGEFKQHRWHSVGDRNNDQSAFSSGSDSGKDRAWLDVYDATAGKKVLELKLKYDGDLLSLSPDGSTAAFLVADSTSRLEVFRTADGARVGSWRPYGSMSGETGQLLTGAALAGNDHVLTLSGDGLLLCWKLDGLSAVWGVTNTSQPVISPGGKYAGYSDGKSYFLVEIATGDIKGVIPETGDVKAASFHPQGGQLALLSEHQGGYYLLTVNVATGEVAAPSPVPVQTPFLQWCNERFLLVDNSKLFDVAQRVTTWTYNLPAGDHLPTTSDGRHWYLLAVQGQPTLVSAQLPGNTVQSQLGTRPLQPEFVLQPGGSCSLSLELNHPVFDGTQKAEIEKRLREQLTSHRVTVADNQPVRLVVKAVETTGEMLKRRFHKFGQIGEEELSYPLKKTTCSVSFVVDGKEAWTTSTTASNDLFFFSSQEGQSTMDAINSNYAGGIRAGFGAVVLPPYVFTPTAANGIGTSELTASGAGL